MIKEARKARRITQKQLGLRLNVTKGYISRLENHPRTCNPHIKLILRLSKVLDLEHLELFSHFVREIEKDLD